MPLCQDPSCAHYSHRPHRMAAALTPVKSQGPPDIKTFLLSPHVPKYAKRLAVTVWILTRCNGGQHPERVDIPMDDNKIMLLAAFLVFPDGTMKQEGWLHAVVKNPRPPCPTLIPRCSVCFKPTPPREKPKKCAGCRWIPYCSRECQRQDWPSHRAICGEIRQINQ